MTHTKIKVDSLKHPYTTEDSGKTQYFVQYAANGKISNKQCTAEVYAKIKTQYLAYDGKKEVTLGVNPTSALVDRIDTNDIKHSQFEVVADEANPQAQRNIAITYLIYTVFSDGYVELKAKPTDTPYEVAIEILDYLCLHHTELKTQDIILNKYLVADIRQNGQYIYIDPSVR